MSKGVKKSVKGKQLKKKFLITKVPALKKVKNAKQKVYQRSSPPEDDLNFHEVPDDDKMDDANCIEHEM